MAIKKIQEGDGLFIGGMNSDIDQLYLQPTQYARGMNVVNRGGLIQCRPGYRCILALPAGRLQGFTVFRPKVGDPTIIFVVEGRVYSSNYPFNTFRQLSALSFSNTARHVYFALTEKTLNRNDDGSLELIAPKNVLVIQDGGFTSPATFDGTTAQHERGEGKIPIGGPMAWSGDRLWVGRGSQVFASDLANPTSFTENLYITGTASFIFRNDVVALHAMSGATMPGPPQLLVFTRENGYLLQSGIRDRSTWTSIPDFQREILPNIGCVSHRSLTTHGGFLWWFSRFGLVSFDTAAQSFVSSALPHIDEEMFDSKIGLSPDLQGVAGSTFENYLLMSVPHASAFNTHTWVMDNSPLESGEKAKPVWNSFWTGTRPVEWYSGSILGRERILYISADTDGNNRLWEAFTPDRLDDGGHITWYAELRGYTANAPAKFKEFRYADFFMTELSGEFDMAVFWAGADRGKYKRILTKKIRASKGILTPDLNITMETELFGVKKQNRYLRTQDVRAITVKETLSSCGVEYPYQEWKDDGVQLLIVGSGPGAIRSTVLYFDSPDQLDDAGKCESDETQERFVRFDGAATLANGANEAVQTFSDDEPYAPNVFFALRAESVTQDGITEVGVGDHTSAISQSDAEKVASTVARRKASVKLQSEVPKRVSIGAA